MVSLNRYIMYKWFVFRWWHIVKSMNRKFEPRLQCIQSATGKNFTEAEQKADMWKEYCEVLYHDEEGNGTGSKSLHHFIQRLLVRSIRQQVAKQQVLITSQQNCSKQEKWQHWTECTEYVWRSGKWWVARGMKVLHIHSTSQERWS